MLLTHKIDNNDFVDWLSAIEHKLVNCSKLTSVSSNPVHNPLPLNIEIKKNQFKSFKLI